MKVATGLALGASPAPELAAKAVEMAMLKANIHADLQAPDGSAIVTLTKCRAQLSITLPLCRLP